MGNAVHLHAHVAGVSLAEVLLWSDHLEALEVVTLLRPELLDVFLMEDFLTTQHEDNMKPSHVQRTGRWRRCLDEVCPPVFFDAGGVRVGVGGGGVIEVEV